MAGDDPTLTFVAKMDDQASKAADTLERNLEQLGGPIDPITGEARLQVTGFERLEELERAADKAFEDVEDEAEESGKETGKKFSGGLSDVLKGGAIVAAGAFAGAMLAESFANALEEGTSQARTTGALGLDPEESRIAGEVAGSLYAQAYGESLSEVSGGVGAVISSIDGMRDATSEAIEEATADALNFADVFEVDVARAAQIVGQMIRTGLVGDAEEGFDLLIAAAQKVPANIREDLLDAVDEYGPFFAAVGASGEDAFALLVAASAQGMYGIDKAGDAIKELGIRATDMSKLSESSFEAAGLNAADMSAKFLAGGDTAAGALDELIDGLLAIEDPVERSNAAIGLFGTPLEDLGVTQIPAFLTALKGGADGMGDFSQASEDLADTLGGTQAAAFETQRREIEKLGTDALATVMPYLLSFLQWARETPGFITAVSVALGIAAVAWAAVTLAASPWLALGLAIAAVIAGVILVIKNWGPILDWIQGVVAGVVAGIAAWFDNLRAWVSEKVNALIGWVRNNWPMILAILTGPIGLAVLWISRHMDEIRHAVSSRIDAVVSFFRELPGKIASAVGNLGGTLLGAGRDVVTGLWNGISGAGSWLMGKLRSWASSVIPGPIKKALGIASPSKVGAALGRWFGIGIGEGIDDEAGFVESRAQNLADAVEAPLRNLDASMGNYGPTVSVAGRSESSEVVTIRHEVTSPDGSVSRYTAEELARMLAGDPTAARITEEAVNRAARRRKARTLTASN